MFVATIVDATDGALARRARVKEVLPDVDGARIDDIVDYITFVFLPMLLLEASGGLLRAAALPVIAVVLLSSMYGFVAPDAKSSDHFFTGFPSYWNIVVLYLMLFRVPPLVNAVVLLALSALVFVRIGYVYPSRTPTLRTLTLLLGVGLGARWWARSSGCGRRRRAGWRSLRSRFPSITPCSRWCSHAPPQVRAVDPGPHHQGSRPGGAVTPAWSPFTAITVVWSMRQGWAVYKLRRGVGDTWFYSADGRRWFRHGRAAP